MPKQFAGVSLAICPMELEGVFGRLLVLHSPDLHKHLLSRANSYELKRTQASG